MKHENQLISAEVEAKDRSDQTDKISSTLGSTAWQRGEGCNEGETSFQRETSWEMGQENSCTGALHHFRSASLRSPILYKLLRKTVCKMLCTLALKDLITPQVPDRLASESHSPCEREFQQQLLPKEEVEEGSGKSCL